MVQRVSHARVTPGGEIGAGLCVLLGVARGDGVAEADRLAAKVANLRIFENEDGKFDRSLLDVGGEALVVSQFTLIAPRDAAGRPSTSGRNWRTARSRAEADPPSSPPSGAKTYGRPQPRRTAHGSRSRGGRSHSDTRRRGRRRDTPHPSGVAGWSNATSQASARPPRTPPRQHEARTPRARSLPRARRPRADRPRPSGTRTARDRSRSRVRSRSAARPPQSSPRRFRSHCATDPSTFATSSPFEEWRSSPRSRATTLYPCSRASASSVPRPTTERLSRSSFAATIPPVSPARHRSSAV